MGSSWAFPHLLRNTGSLHPGVLLQRAWGPGVRSIPQGWGEQFAFAVYRETPQVDRIRGWKKPLCPSPIPDSSEQGSKRTADLKRRHWTALWGLASA